MQGLWPAHGGGGAGARGGGGVAAAVDSACRRNKARKVGRDWPAGGQRLRVRQPVSHDQLQVALFQADSSIEIERAYTEFKGTESFRVFPSLLVR